MKIKINVRKYYAVMLLLLATYAMLIFVSLFVDIDPTVMKLAYTITFPFLIFGAMLDNAEKGKKA